MGTFSARFEGKIKVLNMIKFLQALHKAVRGEEKKKKRPNTVALNEQKGGRAQELYLQHLINS